MPKLDSLGKDSLLIEIEVGEGRDDFYRLVRIIKVCARERKVNSERPCERYEGCCLAARVLGYQKRACAIQSEVQVAEAPEVLDGN